jgi:hypothetical protein
VIVECPYCGKPVVVNGFGRRPLSIPVNKVYDALHQHHSVTTAARELGCSRGYIYKILKDSGLKAEDVSNRAGASRLNWPAPRGRNPRGSQCHNAGEGT